MIFPCDLRVFPERTLFSSFTNFASKVLGRKEVFREISDWYNTPTYVSDFVNASLLLIEKNKEGIFRGGFAPPNGWHPKLGAQLGDCNVCTARHQSLIRNREKRKAQLEFDNNQ